MTIPKYRLRVVRDRSASVKASGLPCDNPAGVAEIVRAVIGSDPREHFVAVYLNARNHPVGFHVVSIGTLTASLVHPREVFGPALVAGAAGIIIAHNHPSGDSRPSPEDIETTHRLVKAGRLLGVGVLDHVIITGAGYTSLRQSGQL